MKIKRLAALILAVMMILAAGLPAHAEKSNKKVTVMIYLCGTDLESRNRQATRSLGDMIASNFNKEEVNVVVLAGGSVYWSLGYSASQLTLLEINGRRPSVVDTLPLASMGDPQTLTNFLNICYERYPAEQYDLVLWDHGGGPNSGVCFDSLFNNDSLTVSDLCSALGASSFANRPLDMLVFHACLMGSAEVANAVSPYAKYMVAGEDSIYGLSYKWLAGMENEDAWTTAKRIVDYSYEQNGETIRAQGAEERNSFAAIDLQRMPELLRAMDAFFSTVTINLNAANFSFMSNQRRDTISFGVGHSGSDSDYDLVDLGDLVKTYRSNDAEKADELLNIISGAVYCHADPADRCSGLTVYHPFFNRKAMEARLSVYNSLHFSEAYTRYINHFAEILLGKSSTSWSNLNVEGDANKATIYGFKLVLNDDQIHDYGAAALLALYKNEDGSYQFVYMDPRTDLNKQKSTLSAMFKDTALYAVGPDGQRLTGMLEYTKDKEKEGVYYISVTLEGLTETGETYFQKAVITCVYDGGKELIPLGVEVWEEPMGYTTAYGTVFSDYQAVYLSNISRKLPENVEEIPSFWDWEIVSEDEKRLEINDSWHFEFVNDAMKGQEENVYIAFQVTDTRNNDYSSNLLPLMDGPWPVTTVCNNDEIETVEMYPAEIEQEGEFCRVSAVVSSSDETEVIINVVNVSVNEAALPDISTTVYGRGMNWGLIRTERTEDGRTVIEPEEQLLSFTVPMDAFSADLAEQVITFDLEVINAVTGEIMGYVHITCLLRMTF